MKTEDKNVLSSMQLTVEELQNIKIALDESSILAVTDQRGIITMVNDRFCKISKYERCELIGKDHRLLNSGYHPNTFLRKCGVQSVQVRHGTEKYVTVQRMVQHIGYRQQLCRF